MIKCFRPIIDKFQLRAICAALNKIFWKLAPIREGNDKAAEFIVKELADRDIVIRWNKAHSRFEIPNIRSSRVYVRCKDCKGACELSYNHSEVLREHPQRYNVCPFHGGWSQVTWRKKK